MTKVKQLEVSKELEAKGLSFLEKLNSRMYFQAELSNDVMSFDWVDEIEVACPYLDNIIRNPRLALINEEDIVKIEKAKRITVASVKDLSKHTHFIESIDPKTKEVKPSKILIERREETFNTYENRFIYTLITNLYRFVTLKEALLEELETRNQKVLEYAGNTNTETERVAIELKVKSYLLPQGKSDDDFKKEIEAIKLRVRKINDYLAIWRQSDFIESLEKARVPFVYAPIRKTNMILKNPNFQIAMKLWEFLQRYDLDDHLCIKDTLETTGDDVIKGILDDSFLINYLVLGAMSKSKREQRDNLHQAALLIFNWQIERAVSFLLNSGLKITEAEIMELLAIQVKKEFSKRIVTSDDVKKKFQKAMTDYLDQVKEYMR